ncbi:MAG: glycosyltransferase family 4 protein [Cyclobacteriaceae bacterium]
MTSGHNTLYINGRFLTQKVTGVQRFCIEVVTRLIRVIPNTVILSPRHIDNKELAKRVNARVIGKYSGYLWEQVELPIYLKKLGSPLLLNLANTGPLLYNNQVTTIHDLAFKRHPEWFSKKVAITYNFLIPKLAQKSRHIFTVSEFSKQEINELLEINHNKITVVANAVPILVSKYHDDIHSSDLLFEERNYVLAVGSLDPRKNMIILIKAFDRIREKHGSELILIGSESKIFRSSKELRKLLNKTGVSFTGYLSDERLRAAYKNARAFIYPSLYEGFGIPPLEAMTFGCPTCVSDIEVLRETCGDASLYFDPKNVESITSALDKILGDKELSSTLKTKGQYQVEKYDWDNSAKLLKSSIHDLI